MHCVMLMISLTILCLFSITDASLKELSMKELVMKHFNPELLNFPTLIPVLNKYYLLTQDDNYILMNPLLSPTKRANALVYMILPSKGPEAFTLFFKCLQEEKEHMGHHELAKLLQIVSYCTCAA